MKKIAEVFIRTGLVAMTAAAVWQGSIAFKGWLELRQRPAQFRTVFVDVTGNVDRPGRYKVPAGMTNFEILKVAGVRFTSNLYGIDLSGQVDPAKPLAVDTLAKAVFIKPEVRLDLTTGDVGVLSSDGQDRIVQQGMTIDEGDRVLTDEKSQAELAFGDMSRVAIDNFAEVSFDKIGLQNGDQVVSSAFQKSGLCWYRMRFPTKNETFQITSAKVKISLSGRAGEVSTDIKFAETTINCIDGLLLVERVDGNEAINLISGQSVTIFHDGRPFVVSKISGDGGVSERFRKLTRARAEEASRHMPLNLLFCSPPQAFYLLSIQFDKNAIDIISIPAQTSTRLYAQGINTLQEAYLYGGTIYTLTIIERILSTRVPKFVVFKKEDIARTVNTIGSVKLAIDDKAATAMNVKAGEQPMRADAILEYLSPAISGVEDSRKRQMTLIKSLFEQTRAKSIVITGVVSEQLVNNVETNFTGTDVMGHYENFMSRQNWRFRSHTLPVKEFRENNAVVYDPDLDKARKLLNEE